MQDEFDFREMIDLVLIEEFAKAMKPFDDALEDLILNGEDGVSPESRRELTGSADSHWCADCMLGYHGRCRGRAGDRGRRSCNCEHAERNM